MLYISYESLHVFLTFSAHIVSLGTQNKCRCGSRFAGIVSFRKPCVIAK